MIKLSKRLCALFLMLVMTICIAGCGNSQRNDTQEQTTQNSTSTETNTD